MFRILNKKKGFTLLEVIVAILVVIVGVLAAYTVTQKIIFYTYRSSSRLTAAYLAQEGIEIVRNIRDTNWLQLNDRVFDGLAQTGYGWKVDYTTTTLEHTDEDSCGDGYN